MSEFEKYLSDYIDNFFKKNQEKTDQTKQPKDTGCGKDHDKEKNETDIKAPKHTEKNKTDKGRDNFNAIFALFAFLLNYITKQKTRSILLTNGNNNMVQVANEAGPDSNIQD